MAGVRRGFVEFLWRDKNFKDRAHPKRLADVSAKARKRTRRSPARYFLHSLLCDANLQFSCSSLSLLCTTILDRESERVHYK